MKGRGEGRRGDVKRVEEKRGEERRGKDKEYGKQRVKYTVLQNT